jgi:hypothetical protein
MTGAETASRDRARLLRHLGQPGAFAVLSPLERGRVALMRPGPGVTLGAGHVEARAADRLVAEGLASWSGRGRGARLVAATGAAQGRSLASRTMIVDGVAETVTIDERESPLLWLHRRAGKDGRPQISVEEFVAGERFRADLTLARMLPSVTMNWDASLTPGTRAAGPRDPAPASDAALAARQRVRRACERLGPELSGLAIDICGFLKGLDQVERERKWPARSAKIVLRLALSALVAHYGVAAPAPAVARRIAAWRAADARPGLSPAG